MPTYKVTFHLATLSEEGVADRVRAVLNELAIKRIEADPLRRQVTVVYDADQVFLHQIYSALEAAGIGYNVTSVDKPAWD